jgi:hypothetical protein
MKNILGLVIEKETDVIARQEKDAAIRLEWDKKHEEEIAALQQQLTAITSMHKAEADRANLMMVLLATGMIQGRMVMHGRGAKKTTMTLSRSMVDNVKTRTDWAIHIQPDETTETLCVSLVKKQPQTAEVVDADKPAA